MIVVDVNVILAALRSSLGASHVVLRAMIDGRVAFSISPAVVLEYEDVLKRRGILGPYSPITSEDIDTLLNALLKRAKLVSPSFRYRPLLNDPKDDLYVDCAIASGATRIVSNDKHFRHHALADFGIAACPAAEIANELKRRTET
ncbi:MAG: putative toxin-antitoxin system toxin component, PIN family [Rhizobium sp.]|nr:putative toxin-antitoxin system toxin component, PIN family [Rhizobium sp.]MCZ8350191.1 putative toxin-antitoxin system toxin component, PIN family [Rhizobium sp.]